MCNIKPVAKNNSGVLCYVEKDTRPVKCFYFWEAPLGGKFKNPKPSMTVNTCHKKGDHDHFIKPTEEEFVAQIISIMPQVVAYEIVGYRHTPDKNSAIATVQLYNS